MCRLLRSTVLVCLVACGSPTLCDEVSDRYRECGIELSGAPGDVKVDGYCEDGSLEACTAQCTLQADCSALGATGTAADGGYLDCLVGCSEISGTL